MLWNAAGLEIVLPSSPRDVKGLLRTAINSDNPTVFINHARLTDIEDDVPEGDYAIPFGHADIKRPGRDVTIVATSFVVHAALAAANLLADEGIEAEVLDPRTLVPFDHATLHRFGAPHRRAGDRRRNQFELWCRSGNRRDRRRRRISNFCARRLPASPGRTCRRHSPSRSRMRSRHRRKKLRQQCGAYSDGVAKVIRANSGPPSFATAASPRE